MRKLDRAKQLLARLEQLRAELERMVAEKGLEHPEVLALNSQVRQRQAPPEVCTDLDWRRLV